MMSERSVALLRMLVVPSISTMNVELPRARSSLAPTREKMRSTRPTRQDFAGTQQPTWARATSRAAGSIYRPCSGPVSRTIWASSQASRVSLDEGRACADGRRVGRTEHLLDDGVATFGDFEDVALVDRRAAVVPLAGEQRPTGKDIEFGERVGGVGEGDGIVEDGGDELVEEFEFACGGVFRAGRFPFPYV